MTSNQINNSNTSGSAVINPISDKGLKQRQLEIMKLQDDMLDDIGDGVTRLHQQVVSNYYYYIIEINNDALIMFDKYFSYFKALHMNDEAKIHTRLLDDLDSDVDIATTLLATESKHVRSIREKSHMCKMYLCVALEVIVIVILLIAAYAV